MNALLLALTLAAVPGAGATAGAKKPVAAELRWGAPQAPRQFSFELLQGANWRLGRPTYASGVYTIETGLGLRLPVSRLVSLWPKAAFVYTDDDASGRHLFAAGLAVAVHLPVTLSLGTHFVVGDAGATTGLGLRTGLRMEVLGGLFTIDLSHRALWRHGSPVHSMRLLFGADFLHWLYTLTAHSGVRRL